MPLCRRAHHATALGQTLICSNDGGSFAGLLRADVGERVSDGGHAECAAQPFRTGPPDHSDADG